MTAAFSPAERSLRARLAAHARWAKDDPVRGTAPARQAFLDRFEREVDPDQVLSPEERARRAEHARRAHMSRLALKSVQARREQKGESWTSD